MNQTKERQTRFMSLYEPVHQPFLRYCEVLTRDPEAAKDLVSEVVLKAYEQLHTLRNDSSFLYFLFGIARNVHRHTIRKDSRMNRLSENENQYAAHGPLPDRLADIGLLYEAMEKLPAKQREALVLFEVSGFPVKEVAAIQGGSVSATKVRLMRARDQLKKYLAITTPSPQRTDK